MKNLTREKISRLRRTLLPIMALLLALSCTLTAGMYANASTLNSLFGRGARTVKPLEQAEALEQRNQALKQQREKALGQALESQEHREAQEREWRRQSEELEGAEARLVQCRNRLREIQERQADVREAERQ